MQVIYQSIRIQRMQYQPSCRCNAHGAAEPPPIHQLGRCHSQVEQGRCDATACSHSYAAAYVKHRCSLPGAELFHSAAFHSAETYCWWPVLKHDWQVCA